MLATIINAAAVVLGSLIGLLFRGRINERYTQIISRAIGLSVAVIGLSSAIRSEYVLGLFVCLIVGWLIGELLNIEGAIGRLGLRLQRIFAKNDGSSRFSEAFISSSLLFCVGSMAVLGCLDAGLSGNYTILLSKSIMDGITAITFAAAMGVGVAFSALFVLAYQGALTLLASAVEPLLSQAVIVEMSAVGGLVLLALAINLIVPELRSKLSVANMMPAIILPLGFVPLYDWLSAIL